MLRRLIKRFLHSASHSHRKHDNSSEHYYGKRHSSSHGFVRPIKRSSSDYKRRHGRMGHGYYKSRRSSSS